MAEAALQKKLQDEIDVYKKLENDFVKNVKIRQQLESQKTENTMVYDELKLLTDDCVVYKLVGPMLMKQDTVESIENVSKRIKYIDGELKRFEGVLKGLEEEREKEREVLAKLQTQLGYNKTPNPDAPVHKI